MVRLAVLVEGQTEHKFVSVVLAPFLRTVGFELVYAKLLGKSGGICNWDSAKRDILRTLNENSAQIVTTMVDFYGLPQHAQHGWPGRRDADSLAFERKIPHLHAKISAAVLAEMGTSFDARRFVPNVLMHEFEALLFSDCTRFASAIGRPEIKQELMKILHEDGPPEHINDSVETAPSKRIAKLVPGYQKPSQGLLAAEAIGLETIRRECLLFNDWLNRLAQAQRELS
jgi:hypothetical protein